jgi:hydrogenase/urease accessory protein HupE
MLMQVQLLVQVMLCGDTDDAKLLSVELVVLASGHCLHLRGVRLSKVNVMIQAFVLRIGCLIRRGH